MRSVSAVFGVATLLLSAGRAMAATTSCSTVAACVFGSNTSTGYGVEGTSKGNDGVVGMTTENATSASAGKAGVAGYDSSVNKNPYNSGVYGASAYGDGVQGKATSGTGVLGLSGTGTGVIGKGRTYGGYFTATNGVGIYASGARITSTATIDSLVSSGASIGFLAGASGNTSFQPSLDVGPGYPLGSDSGAPDNTTIRAYGNANLGTSDNLFIGVECFSDPDSPNTACKDTVSIDALGNAIFAGQVTQSGTPDFRTRTATGVDVESFGARTSSPTIEDFGTASLRNGLASVVLDRTFASTISPGYMVFITPDGDSNGLYTTQKTSSGFIVHENKGGRSSLTFDYRIVAKPLDAKPMHLPAMAAFPQPGRHVRARARG